jgi:circadian clock protein KaiC
MPTTSSKIEPIVRVSSGCEGLDDVLHGGLERNHLYLLEGAPGTGKTTLALQFLLNGVRAGEKCLYVTLSESKRELQGVAKSHGWSLDSIPIFEMSPQGEELSPDAQYTVFHPTDVELADTTASVLKQVDQVQPSRAVFDSLAELRMLARDPLRYRRQLLGLRRHFAARNCTVLLLDAEGNDVHLQTIAHGAIILQSLEREFGITRRRLEVRKIRGSKFREGLHDYSIETGGLVVYPRLVAAEQEPDYARRPVPSGLKGLDELLGGGIDSGTSTLLMGPAGCGKSSIAIRYLLSAAERGEGAVMFTFDETIPTLLHRAEGLGMSLKKHLASGKIQLQQVDPAELSPGEFVHRVRALVEPGKVKLVVIDSLNGFLHAMPGENFLAMQMHEMLSYMSQRGVATLLTLAQHGLLGSNMNSPVDISYLADSVILFRYFEAGGEVKQAISVVKKRSGTHERTIRELSFKDSKVRVGAALTEFEGVLTGVPKYRGSAGDLSADKPGN